MRIGICDDNIEEQKQYIEHLKQLGYSDVSVFHSGEEILQDMPELDLLFLDVEMQEITGIDVKNFMEEHHKNTYIVFYTTHIEAMPDGFGSNVLGFLHKPITSEELKLYIDKVSMKLQRNHPITLENNSIISSDHVLYIESDHNYTLIHQTDANPTSIRKSLQQWSDELSAYGFIMIHRSCLINLLHVRYVENTSAVLTNGQTLPISRQYLAQTKESVKNYQLKLCNPNYTF